MSEIKQKLEIRSNNYLYVLDIIRANGGQARLVGGVVRDAILNQASSDVDIATDMLPEKVSKTFTALGYKVVPTGIKFGTVLVIYKGELFEVTTLRKDMVCDGRRAKVEYSNDFRLDAERRDFTINALSYCPFTETIYDYFHGFEDLLAGKVRFIGVPDLRIQEDHLRILRFFRFFGRFGKELDHNSFESCIKHKIFLKKLSRERIHSELDLILKLPNYINILALLHNSSILSEILPTNIFDQKKFIIAEEIAQKFALPLAKEIKYALLLMRFITIEELMTLKFSRLESKKISSLLGLLQSADKIDENFLKTLWFQEKDFASIFIFLAVITGNKEYERIFKKLYKLPKPIFPVNGNDMVLLGFKDEAIKFMLEKLKAFWIDSDFTLSKHDLIKIAHTKDK